MFGYSLIFRNQVAVPDVIGIDEFGIFSIGGEPILARIFFASSPRAVSSGVNFDTLFVTVELKSNIKM